MHRFCLAAVVMTAGLLSAGQAALAQDAAQPVYIVTYTEVAPRASSEARKLILTYAADMKKASGAVQVDALQRISDPGHFALIEQWQSLAAKQAFAATDPATKFRAALNPLQSAAYDERIHTALSVGPSTPASGDPVVILDPRRRRSDAGRARHGQGEGLRRAGPRAAGNRRFDDLVQISRKNHFTVVESWDSLADKSAWISTKTARTFREELQPMSGALYDERAFKLLR